MSAIPRMILCSKCHLHKATKNCESCNEPICLNCIRITFIRFSTSSNYSLNGNYSSSDYERVRRCEDCDKNKKNPRTGELDADSCNLM